MVTLAEKFAARPVRDDVGKPIPVLTDEEAKLAIPVKKVKTVQTVIGGDGTVEQYDDRYAEVTEEMVKKAEELEAQILDNGRRVTGSYLRMARDLSDFKREKLYLARGYDSFKDWADSPEISSVGWRTAYNLVRIADEVIPMLERNNLLDETPSISNLYDLLPILNDDDGEAKFIAAMRAIKGLSNRDAKRAIKEVRGITANVGDRTATMFRCKVKRGTEFHTVRITANDNVDHYECGVVRIKLKDWSRWASLYGEENIEYVEE